MQLLKTSKKRPDRTRAWRRIAAAVLVAGACLAPCHSALAQKRSKTEGAEATRTKSYLLPYALVILIMGLGLMVICRTDIRADKERAPKTDDHI